MKTLQTSINQMSEGTYTSKEIMAVWQKQPFKAKAARQLKAAVAGGLLQNISCAGKNSQNHILYEIRH